MGLANVGCALLLYNLIELQFGYYSPALLAFVYLFLILGVFMMIMYGMSLVFHPKVFYRQELSSPEGMARLGAFSMATCLLGKICYVIRELSLPVELATVLVLTGACIQFSGMMRFFYTWWVSQQYPEPYFHNGMHSCVMVTICLPGTEFPAVVIRHFFLSIGLVLLLPNCGVITARVLWDPKVANNPLVSI